MILVDSEEILEDFGGFGRICQDFVDVGRFGMILEIFEDFGGSRMVLKDFGNLEEFWRILEDF